MTGAGRARVPVISSQVLPLLTETIRWYNIEILHEFWMACLPAEGSLISYVALMSLRHVYLLDSTAVGDPAQPVDRARLQIALLRARRAILARQQQGARYDCSFDLFLTLLQQDCQAAIERIVSRIKSGIDDWLPLVYSIARSPAHTKPTSVSLQVLVCAAR